MDEEKEDEEEEEREQGEGREPRCKGGQLFSGLRSVISSFRPPVRGGEEEEDKATEEKTD